MKHCYLLIAFVTFSFSQAQIVNIPDANFKDALINYPFFPIDTNGDGEIQVSEAAIYPYGILVYNRNIADLTGIEAFINIDELSCQGNLLTSLDVTQNTKLIRLEFWDNQITTIDLSQNLLLGGLLIGRNLLTELDVSANVGLIELWADDNMFTSLDLTNHPLLDVLFCDGNMIQTLDLSQNNLLTSFDCSDNGMTQLILPENPLILEGFSIQNNFITDIDFSNMPLLQGLNVSNNPLSTLDFSSNPMLERVYCNDMPQLQSIFLKNGSAFEPNELSLINTPNIKFICADQFEITQLENELATFGYTDVVVNGYCSFAPGGKVTYVRGYNYVDFEGDGCGSGDPVYPFLKYLISNGTTQEYFFNDANGFFNIPLPEGTYTMTPILENLDYFTISPSLVTLELTEADEVVFQNFCITSDEIYTDLEVFILPLQQLRPGFDADFQIVYKNKGNIPLSGSVEFNFSDSYVDFISATQNPDFQNVSGLSWNYVNLQPLESRGIVVKVNINTPTDPNFPVNGGDYLSFEGVVNPIPNDANMGDNVMPIKIRVVNSFDPNDKTCLEGDTIAPEMVGEFVHYMIRFENTGTADAINVVVKDNIDITQFDVTSIIPLKASHDFVTRITNTNELEFIFENINLPFDDANNDGYITFKIKTLPTLALGDTFSNDAEIYFDYNAPIVTNDYTTNVQEPLAINDLQADTIKIYPNPVKDLLTLEGNASIQSITIYESNGRLVGKREWLGNALKHTVDLSQLAPGIYLVRVTTSTGIQTIKVVKE